MIEQPVILALAEGSPPWRSRTLGGPSFSPAMRRRCVRPSKPLALPSSIAAARACRAWPRSPSSTFSSACGRPSMSPDYAGPSFLWVRIRALGRRSGPSCFRQRRTAHASPSRRAAGRRCLEADTRFPRCLADGCGARRRICFPETGAGDTLPAESFGLHGREEWVRRNFARSPLPSGRMKYARRRSCR